MSQTALCLFPFPRVFFRCKCYKNSDQNFYTFYTQHSSRTFQLMAYSVNFVNFASFVFILSCTLPNLYIPDVPFPTLLSTLIRRQFPVKPATFLIPIDLLYFLLTEEFYGTWHQSVINVGSVFILPA